MGNEVGNLNLYPDKEDPINIQSKQAGGIPPVRDYTRAEVQQHNDEENDFWIIVRTGSSYGVYDITAMTKDPSIHPGCIQKFLAGLNEAKRNEKNGNDVSQLMGSGTPQSHSWSLWPNALNRTKYDLVYMGDCSDP